MRAVAEARSEGRIVINPLIYAEVAIAFRTQEETEAGLPATLFDRERQIHGDAGLGCSFDGFEVERDDKRAVRRDR